MQEMKPIKEGKVREIYDNGDSLIMVATDRISCFDVILNNVVTKKGTVLTQMSKFWFEMTEDILPNHMISTDVKDMPEYFQQDQFDGNSMMCRKLDMLPLECIVRGYITGSGWESYKKTGKVCGIELPEGLKESDKLPEPIYTPSTKAEIGDHDENISFEQSVEHLEKYYPGKVPVPSRSGSVQFLPLHKLRWAFFLPPQLFSIAFSSFFRLTASFALSGPSFSRNCSFCTLAFSSASSPASPR